MKKAPKPETKSGAVEQLGNTLKWIPWLWVIVTLPLMGFQAAFHTAVDQVSPITDEMKGLWGVFIKTAPLCTTVLLITIAAFREWFDGWGMWLFGAASLIVLTMLITKGGRDMVGEAWNTHTGSPLTAFPIKLLGKYFDVYEWRYFVSSLILGIFLGWVWAKKIIPVFKTV